MKNHSKLFIIMALVIFSCARNTSGDKNELLTSKAWRLDAEQPNENQHPQEIITFSKDGSYSLASGALKVNGKWSWKTNDEIYLIIDGISSDNGDATFDKTSNYNIRILEIEGNHLRLQEKGEGDSWESGFAKEKKFTAEK
jgi:hypothetical protein